MEMHVVNLEKMPKTHTCKNRTIVYDQVNRTVNDRNVYEDIFDSHYPMSITALSTAHGSSNKFYIEMGRLLADCFIYFAGSGTKQSVTVINQKPTHRTTGDQEIYLSFDGGKSFHLLAKDESHWVQVESEDTIEDEYVYSFIMSIEPCLDYIGKKILFD